MLKFTFDKKTGKTLVQRKTAQTKKTTSGKTYVVYEVLGFIERSSIDLTVKQKHFAVPEVKNPQQRYIYTQVGIDLANIFCTEYVFRKSSKALELTEEEQAEVESKSKELTQNYKAFMRLWLTFNRDMLNLSFFFAFVNEEPHQMDIDEVIAESNKVVSEVNKS